MSIVVDSVGSLADCGDFSSDNSRDKSDLKSQTSSVNLKYEEESKSNCRLGEPSHAETISQLKGLGRCYTLLHCESGEL